MFFVGRAEKRSGNRTVSLDNLVLCWRLLRFQKEKETPSLPENQHNPLIFSTTSYLPAIYISSSNFAADCIVASSQKLAEILWVTYRKEVHNWGKKWLQNCASCCLRLASAVIKKVTASFNRIRTTFEILFSDGARWGFFAGECILTTAKFHFY